MRKYEPLHKELLKHFPVLEKYSNLEFRLKQLRKIAEKLELFSDKTTYFHIAGTSGKGSITISLHYLFSELGYKTGSFTSPFIQRLEENYLIDEKEARSEDLKNALKELAKEIKRLQIKDYWPSFFEAKVLLALKLFKKEKCKIVILETGLGGRYDATNIIEEKISIISRIGKDHTEILGKTYQKIAKEKAGIIKLNNPLIFLWQRKDVNEVILKKAQEQKAKIYPLNIKREVSGINLSLKETSFLYKTLDNKFVRINTNLLGIHQVENTALALRALEVYLKNKNRSIEESLPQIRKALKKVKLIARLEIKRIADKTLIIDSAHNPQKIASLVKSLQKISPKTRFSILLSLKHTKDPYSIVCSLKKIANQVFYFEYEIDNLLKSHSYDEIEKIAKELGLKITQIKAQEIDKLIKTSAEKNWLLTGSMYGISAATKESKLIYK